MVPKVIKESPTDLNRFSSEFRKQTSVAIVTAFVFLMALVWRDFFSELVLHLVDLFRLNGPMYIYRLIIAVVVTGLSVIGILFASRMHVHADKDK